VQPATAAGQPTVPAPAASAPPARTKRVRPREALPSEQVIKAPGGTEGAAAFRAAGLDAGQRRTGGLNYSGPEEPGTAADQDGSSTTGRSGGSNRAARRSGGKGKRPGGR
jgi:hypothetical protein